MSMRIAKRTPVQGEQLVIVVEESGRVTCGTKSVRMTPGQIKLFIHMADRSPRICTREQIMVAIRPPSRHDEEIEVDSVKVLVSKLRNVLDHVTDMEVIETVRGVGYRIPNYVEVRTNVNEGENIRIPSDVFAMLINLAFEAKKPLQDTIREVLIEGGKLVQERVNKEIDENLLGNESFKDDPWA